MMMMMMMMMMMVVVMMMMVVAMKLVYNWKILTTQERSSLEHPSTSSGR